MKHRFWIFFSGLVWFAIGGFLTFKGLRLISEATFRNDTLCFSWQTLFGSPAQVGTLLIALGLVVGFIKGRFVLSKTVHRVSMRIMNLASPIRFFDVYAPSYWILIGSMIGLGISLRFLPIPIDVRGFIDVAVGSALLNGSMLYFRFAKTCVN
jgi:hypothetical protein